MGVSDSMELSAGSPRVAGDSGAEELSLEVEVLEVLWGSPSSIGSVSSLSPPENSYKSVYTYSYMLKLIHISVY